MRKKLLAASVLINVLLFGGILVLIHLLGGWQYFLYKIQNRGVAGTYQHRTELLDMLPIEGGDIVFLGNSLTDHGEWSELFGLPYIKNRGIAGEGVAGVKNRLPAILEAQPRLVVLMIGINDLLFHDTDFVLDQYQELLQVYSSKTRATPLIIQSILPVNNVIKNTRIRNRDVVVLNEGISALARQYDCTFVDVHPYFTDEKGQLNSDYSVDGIHLNGEGYLLWKKILLSTHPEIFDKDKSSSSVNIE